MFCKTTLTCCGDKRSLLRRCFEEVLLGETGSGRGESGMFTIESKTCLCSADKVYLMKLPQLRFIKLFTVQGVACGIIRMIIVEVVEI